MRIVKGEDKAFERLDAPTRGVREGETFLLLASCKPDHNYNKPTRLVLVVVCFLWLMTQQIGGGSAETPHKRIEHWTLAEKEATS